MTRRAGSWGCEARLRPRRRRCCPGRAGVLRAGRGAVAGGGAMTRGPNYYNEHDPYAAAWLRNLIAAGHIAPGDVDERSILDVQPADLAGYVQCHFFAGIGVWSHALRLA